MNYWIVSTVLFLLLLSGCAKPFIVESQISKPLVFTPEEVSSEPTIFVRAHSLEAGGARDLDLLIEGRFKKVNHRIVGRAETAVYKLDVKLVYLGPANNLNVAELLSSGYGTQVSEYRSTVNSPKHDFEYISVIDLELTADKKLPLREEKIRILTGIRRPMPDKTNDEIRTALLEKAADQVSVFFEY